MNCWQTHERLLHDWNVYHCALSHTIPSQVHVKALVTDGIKLVNFILCKAAESRTYAEELTPFVCELMLGVYRENNLLLKTIYSSPDVIHYLLKYVLSLSLEDMAALFEHLNAETTLKYLSAIVATNSTLHNATFSMALKVLKRFLTLRHDSHGLFVHLLPSLRYNLESGVTLCSCTCNKNDSLHAEEKVRDRTSGRFVCLQFWNYIARQELFMNSAIMHQIILDWCHVLCKQGHDDRKEAIVTIIGSIFYHRRRDEWYSCMDPLRHVINILVNVTRTCTDTALWTAACCALIQMWKHFPSLHANSSEFFSLLLKYSNDPPRNVMSLYCLQHLSLKVLPLQDRNMETLLYDIFAAADAAVEKITAAEDLRYLIYWMRNVHVKCRAQVTIAYQDQILSIFNKIHKKIRIKNLDDEYDHIHIASFINGLYTYIEKFPKLRTAECHQFLDFCMDRVEEYFAVDASFEEENDFVEKASCINYSEHLCATIMLMTSQEREQFFNEKRIQRLHTLIQASMRDNQRLGLRDFVYRVTGCLSTVQLLDRVILSSPTSNVFAFVYHTLVPMMVQDIPRMFKQCTDESTLHRCVLLSALSTMGEIICRYPFNNTQGFALIKHNHLDSLVRSIFKICGYNYKVIMIDSDNRIDGIAQNITFEAALLLLARLGMVYTDDIAPILWSPIIDDGDVYDSVAMALCIAAIDHGGDFIRGLFHLCESFVQTCTPTPEIDIEPLVNAIQRAEIETRKERQFKRIRVMLNIMQSM